MLKELTYPVVLTEDKEDGGFVVTFPDLPEAITQGETVKEALEEAADCLEEAMAARIVNKDDIPQPSKRTNKQYLVAIPVQTAVKVALYLAMKESGLTKVALAEKLGLKETEVRRILNPRYRSKVPRMAEVLAVLGYDLEIKVAKRRAKAA